MLYIFVHFFSFNPDPTVRHTWFSLLIGGGATFVALYGTNQVQIQRYLTVKDVKMAQKALWLCLPILVSLCLCTAVAGFAIFARYRNCDPYDAKYINNFDQVNEKNHIFMITLKSQTYSLLFDAVNVQLRKCCLYLIVSYCTISFYLMPPRSKYNLIQFQVTI